MRLQVLRLRLLGGQQLPALLQQGLGSRQGGNLLAGSGKGVHIIVCQRVDQLIQWINCLLHGLW